MNYCESFRFNDGYCDVFEEDNHYLYAECEQYYMRYPFAYTCKEFTPAHNGAGYIAGCYNGASYEYLMTLKPANEDIARAIIASEERYTLECMAGEYGYTRQYVINCYLELVNDGENYHDAFTQIACCMMERDL